MVKLAPMFDAHEYSPVTTLAEDFEAKGTFVDFTVTDASIFSDLPFPNIITLMYEDKAESITVTKLDGNTLSGARHHANETLWKKGTLVARVFTALDYERFKENITRLNDGKVDAKEGHSLITTEEQLTILRYSTRSPINIAMLDSFKETGRYLVAPDPSAILFDGPMVVDIYSSVGMVPDGSGGVVQELRGLQDPSGEVLYRVYINDRWTDWKEASNNKLQREVDSLKSSGVETNRILVDALNSKEVPASTNDSIRDNVKKVEDIEANYDWKIKNLLHYSNFNNGWYKWQGNQSATLKTTDDNGVKVTFNQTNSTPGLRRGEADIFLDKITKTLSFLVKHSNPSNSTIAYFFDEDGEKVAEGPRLTQYNEKGYTKYVMTFSLPSAAKYQLMILTNSPKSSDDYMVIKDIMIENGREANIYRPFILQNHDYREVSEWTTLTGNGESKRFAAGYYPDAFHVKADIRNLKGANIKKGAIVGGVTGTYEPKIGLKEKTYYYRNLQPVNNRGTKYLRFPGDLPAEVVRYGIIEGGDTPGNRWGRYSLTDGKALEGSSSYHIEKVVPITPDSEHIEVTVWDWTKNFEIRVTVFEPYIMD